MINVYQEDKLFSKQLVKERIRKIEIIQEARFLLIQTDYGLKSFKIKKGVKTHDMEGHTDAIIKIIVLEPHKMIQNPFEKIPDSPKVITASFDNSILLWDYEKLEIITKMEAPEHSELSCMTFLQKCCLVATGHEDGAIRLWNLEINSSVLLKCHESQKHREAISCIHGCEWNDSEYLICGDYQGRLTIWEISEKSTGGSDGQNATIFPQLRHMIENWKNEKEIDPTVPENMNPANVVREEILCLSFWEQPKINTSMVDTGYGGYDMDGAAGESQMYGRDDRQRNSEGFIIVGGNFRNIMIYSIRNATLEKQLVGHTDSVTCMAFDGNILFTGGDDSKILQWNLALISESYKASSVGEHKDSKFGCFLLTGFCFFFSCHPRPHLS